MALHGLDSQSRFNRKRRYFKSKINVLEGEERDKYLKRVTHLNLSCKLAYVHPSNECFNNPWFFTVKISGETKDSYSIGKTL